MRLQVTPLLCVFILLFSLNAVAEESKNAASEREKIRAAIESQLPAPPDGFGWQIYKNVVFAKPEKWNEAERKSESNGKIGRAHV